jgi:hypothetical protein
VTEIHEFLERRGLEVGRRQEADLGGYRWLPVDLDHPAIPVDLPVRFKRLSFAPPNIEIDDGLADEDSLPADVDPRNTSRRNGPRRHLEIRCGLGEFGFATHVVEFDAERVAHQPDGLAEDRSALRGHRLQVRVVDRLAEAHRLLGLR